MARDLLPALQDARSLLGLRSRMVDDREVPRLRAEVSVGASVVTLPAENQQTVEAALAVGAKDPSLPPEWWDAARAALRDLVAQAELAAEMRQGLEWIALHADTAVREGYLHLDVWRGVQTEARSMLARLDGAR